MIKFDDEHPGSFSNNETVIERDDDSIDLIPAEIQTQLNRIAGLMSTGQVTDMHLRFTARANNLIVHVEEAILNEERLCQSSSTVVTAHHQVAIGCYERITRGQSPMCEADENTWVAFSPSGDVVLEIIK